jgi:hypothetical protein
LVLAEPNLIFNRTKRDSNLVLIHSSLLYLINLLHVKVGESTLNFHFLDRHTFK